MCVADFPMTTSRQMNPKSVKRGFHNGVNQQVYYTRDDETGQLVQRLVVYPTLNNDSLGFP